MERTVRGTKTFELFWKIRISMLSRLLLLTIGIVDDNLGAQAGKHVYVEKPMSHDITEGRVAVEA